MASKIVGKIVAEAANDIETAVHKAMNQLVDAKLQPIEITAALLTLGQNAAALPLARILKAAPGSEGLAMLADNSDEFLRGVLQRACDFAGISCTVQLEMPKTEVRTAH